MPQPTDGSAGGTGVFGSLKGDDTYIHDAQAQPKLSDRLKAVYKNISEVHPFARLFGRDGLKAEGIIQGGVCSR